MSEEASVEASEPRGAVGRQKPNEKIHSAAVPGEWAARQLLGPVMTELGEDLRRAYQKGRDAVIKKATAKVDDLEDGRRANIRVAKDVLMQGSFTDDEVCAEYFGGVLASARSEDGNDDSAISYVGAIQSMSSRQLRLHYLLYNELNRLMAASDEKVNVGQSNDLAKWEVFVPTTSLLIEGIDVTAEMVALFRLGLVSQWSSDVRELKDSKGLPYLKATPTTFGVLLYSVAHNRLSSWTKFGSEYFGSFEGVKPLGVAERSLVELASLYGGELKNV